MFPNADYSGRLDAVRALMAERDVDVLLLSVGSDLPYLSGYEAMPLERLTMLVVLRDGPVTMVIPRLEAPRVQARGGAFAIYPWDETEDPVAIVADLAGSPAMAAIGDHTWSRFLLGLQDAMAGTRFVTASPMTSALRIRKDAGEVAWLRAAGEATDRVVDRLDDEPFAGRTEREVARRVAQMTVEEGHDVAAFAIVASGPNGASPHHEPTGRVIEPGDAVVIDFGGRVKGYHSDTTRTFSVGEPAQRVAEAYAVLREAQRAAVAAVRPGVSAESVDAAARGVIAAAGYGEYFVHRTGHGIGLEGHEEPYIVAGNTLALEPGMAFSIEPGIYVPGEFGMRIEDIVVVAADGVDRLNRSPRRLHIVD
jgi:Xaa-Pro aminopeptidase